MAIRAAPGRPCEDGAMERTTPRPSRARRRAVGTAHRPERLRPGGCGAARRLEAELAVRGLPTPLLARGETLFLEQFLRVGDLGLVDVPASNAACELPVPVVLDDHEPAAARAPTGRCTSDHSHTPVLAARPESLRLGAGSVPPGLADGFGSTQSDPPSLEGSPQEVVPPVPAQAGIRQSATHSRIAARGRRCAGYGLLAGCQLRHKRSPDPRQAEPRQSPASMTSHPSPAGGILRLTRLSARLPRAS